MVTDRPSRYHIGKQTDGRGWMILRLDAIGQGWSTRATVVDANLTEQLARERLADLRAAEATQQKGPSS